MFICVYTRGQAEPRQTAGPSRGQARRQRGHRRCEPENAESMLEGTHMKCGHGPGQKTLHTHKRTHAHMHTHTCTRAHMRKCAHAYTRICNRGTGCVGSARERRRVSRPPGRPGPGAGGPRRPTCRRCRRCTTSTPRSPPLAELRPPATASRSAFGAPLGALVTEVLPGPSGSISGCAKVHMWGGNGLNLDFVWPTNRSTQLWESPCVGKYAP